MTVHALELAMRRPGQTVLSALAAAICVAVVINALAFQTKRHPAPLFAAKETQQVSQPAARGERPAPAPSTPVTEQRSMQTARAATQGAPVPPARPSGIGALIEQTSRPPAPAVQPVAQASSATGEARPVPPQPVPAQPVPARRDQIAQLLQGVEIAPQSATRVAAAQRALTRLGYGNLAADGALGPGTAAALRQFEQDRNLPVTGELSPRTVRALAAEAGIPIE